MDTRATVNNCDNLKRMNTEAWVFTGLDKDSIFKRFNTTTEAIVEALKHKGAHLLKDGTEVKYGRITEGVVYYQCADTKEIVILES